VIVLRIRGLWSHNTIRSKRGGDISRHDIRSIVGPPNVQGRLILLGDVKNHQHTACST
jgi:hypothetical protein